ncbi:MAG: hypothetical protein HFG15_00545 [Bacilli bacterium]|nr:hypothetical protein [Bacilli bacterium]
MIKANHQISLGHDYYVVKEGKFFGISIGTNLGCTINLLGTTYMPKIKGTLLFFEAFRITQKECAQRWKQLHLKF